MNSQQYTGLQAVMPQGSGARVQVQGGEGTTFDVNFAVKKITEVGEVVANHIQKTQDANRQIDFTLMQSENATKDKEAQQVLATLDETGYVTLPDGTRQKHNEYVDSYSQAKNQKVTDFRSKYNYGHYTNDKIDVATRSVLETSSVENTFIKQQNELEINTTRTVNGLKLLVADKEVSSKVKLDTIKEALKNTLIPKNEQDKLEWQLFKEVVTLSTSRFTLQNTQKTRQLVDLYGANPERLHEEVLKWKQGDEYKQHQRDLIDLQEHMLTNPNVAVEAAKTEQALLESNAQDITQAISNVRGDQAVYLANLNAAAIQNGSAAVEVALMDSNSESVSLAMQALSNVFNNPNSSKEDKFKANEAVKRLMEAKVLNSQIQQKGILNVDISKVKDPYLAQSMASMQAAEVKRQEAAAEKAARDAEKQQDKLARLFSPTPTITNQIRAELKAQGVPVEVWEQMSGGTRWTDTELYQQVTINGLTQTAKQYTYGTPQFETVMKVYDTFHNFTKNESTAITQLATNRNEAIGMREAYALHSELLKNNKRYNDIKYKIVQTVSADSSGLSAMGLSLPTLVDLSTALVMEEKHLDGLNFSSTSEKQLTDDVTAKVKELGSTYKNKTLLSLDAKNYVTKNLNQYYTLPPAIKGVLIPQDYLYSDKARQNAPVIATINSIGKVISGYGLPPLTISSPTRNKSRIDKQGKAIPTMHDEKHISHGVVAIDVSANSDPAKVVDALLGGIGGMQAVGSNVEVRGGGRDFANAYSLWSYVKQHGNLPAQSAGLGYDHLTKAQRADLVIKLKSIKTFQNEGPQAENHLHFNCRINPNKIWDNLPDETRKQAQNFYRRGGR